MFFIVAYKMYFFSIQTVCVCLLFNYSVSSDYWNLLINPTPPLHSQTHAFSLRHPPFFQYRYLKSTSLGHQINISLARYIKEQCSKSKLKIILI